MSQTTTFINLIKTTLMNIPQFSLHESMGDRYLTSTTFILKHEHLHAKLISIKTLSFHKLWATVSI